MNQIPRIVQIEISRSSDFWNGARETVLALCEDGSLWRLIKTTSVFPEERWRPISLEKERRDGE